MSSTSTNNKIIAKNTFFMYLRMLLVLFVSLYTSRIVLKTLGVEDFGIYSVVGGVVVLFTFINQTLSTATQRHLSYELGKDNSNIKEVFSGCMKIHIILGLVVFILCETVGLWFINTQMNFPENRMNVVNWVYQFSILGCIINILRVPYNATIIAYEHLSFYAYSGIAEAGLKLGIAYALLLIKGDKLLGYAILIYIVSTLITIWYALYCHINFKDIRIISGTNRKLYIKLLSFSGWTMFGSMASVGHQQGVNMIANIFWGVTVNAAVGIANQVNGTLAQFVNGFQQALNPQLVKSEAANDRERQFDLIYKSSKFSYLIMLLISVPIIADLDYILKIWLGEYPNHSSGICALIIIGTLIDCLSGPLITSIYATGKIRKYQITISLLLLSNIPCAYTAGLIGTSPESIYEIRCITYVIGYIIRLYFLKRLIQFKLSNYFNNVFKPICFVTILYVIPIVIYLHCIQVPKTLFLFLVEICSFIIYGCILIYMFGFTKSERRGIMSLIKLKH